MYITSTLAHKYYSYQHCRTMGRDGSGSSLSGLFYCVKLSAVETAAIAIAPAANNNAGLGATPPFCKG